MTYPNAYNYPPAIPASRTNGFGVTSLILGIWSIVTCVIPLFIGLILAGVPSILGVIFGIVGIFRGQKYNTGVGMAVTGTVLSSLTIVLFFFGAGTVW